MEKEFWVSLTKNDYQIPHDHTLANLTEVLFGYLGNTDPEMRDDIAYIVYANWLKRGMYSSEELDSHVKKLLANLDIGIGETESDTVFLRSFSVLLLAEIVHHDNKNPILEKEWVRAILTKGLWYLEAEQDLRGYVPVKGWAHALAHTADLMLVLALNRATDEIDLEKMLSAVSARMIHSTNHLYVHGEDERLASAILDILRRNLVPFDRVETWTKSFLTPENKDWKGAYVDEPRNRAFQNTRNLLRSTYLALAAQPSEFHDRGRLMAIVFASLRSLRPY